VSDGLGIVEEPAEDDFLKDDGGADGEEGGEAVAEAVEEGGGRLGGATGGEVPDMRRWRREEQGNEEEEEEASRVIRRTRLRNDEVGRGREVWRQSSQSVTRSVNQSVSQSVGGAALLLLLVITDIYIKFNARLAPGRCMDGSARFS